MASVVASSRLTTASSDASVEKLFKAPVCSFVPPPLGDPSALERRPPGDPCSSAWQVDGDTQVSILSGSNNLIPHRHVLSAVSPDAREGPPTLPCLPTSNHVYAEGLQQLRQLLHLYPSLSTEEPCSTSGQVQKQTFPYNDAAVEDIGPTRSRRNSVTGRGKQYTAAASLRQAAVVNLLTQGGFQLLYFLIKYWHSCSTRERRGGSTQMEVDDHFDEEERGEEHEQERTAEGSGAESERQRQLLQLELLYIMIYTLDQARSLASACAPAEIGCTGEKLKVQLLVLKRIRRGAARTYRRYAGKKRRAWVAATTCEGVQKERKGGGGEGNDVNFDPRETEDQPTQFHSSSLALEEDGSEDEDSDSLLQADHLWNCNSEEEEEEEEKKKEEREKEEEEAVAGGQCTISGQDALSITSTVRSFILCVSFFADWLLSCVLKAAEQRASHGGKGTAEAGEHAGFRFSSSISTEEPAAGGGGALSSRGSGRSAGGKTTRSNKPHSRMNKGAAGAPWHQV